jgi:hypothetical protein
MTSANGFTSGLWFAIPIRRSLAGSWFQPLVKIGSKDTVEQLLVSIDGTAPVLSPQPAKIDDVSSLGWFSPIPQRSKVMAEAQWDGQNLPKRFVAEFTAEDSGPLFLYVNDAVNVFWFFGGYKLFYKNNSGTAEVWLQLAPLPEKPSKPPS